MLGARAFWSLLMWLPIGFKSHSHVLDLWPNDDIVPFNASTLIPRLEGAIDLPPIGPCKLTPIRYIRPRFFPVSFNIWTRNGSLKEVATQIIQHVLHLPGAREPILRNYEFNLTSLMSSSINPWSPLKRTVLIVPGFRTKLQVDWMDDIRKLWLQVEDVNVIEVYWPMGNSHSYGFAVASTKIVARQITMLLYYLAQLNGIDFSSRKFGESIHFVGHSLGAHIAGFVGQEMGGRVGRITGLDPAGPFFRDIDQRLDRSDAIFVDAIHTNVGKMNLERLYLMLIMDPVKLALSRLNPLSLFRHKKSSKRLAERYERKPSNTIWFGLPGPIGHLDYYANGGSLQPGCDDDLHVCDHHRATQLYIDLLRYEQSTRMIHNVSRAMLKRFRMVALPSPNLDHFESTRALVHNCPLLGIQAEPVANDSVETRRNGFRRCAVPMDMLAPGLELKEDLERDYGDLPPDQRVRNLYFLTNNKEPYVGEQHLMQLHLSPGKPVLWSKGCKLTALVRSSTDAERVSLVNYELDNLDALFTDTSNSLILPFASPVDWTAYYPTPLTFASSLNQTDTQLGSSSEIGPYLPGELSIELTHIDDRLNQRIQQCQLHIDFIETRAFTRVNYNIGVWYGLDQRGLPRLSGHPTSLDLVIDNTRKYETVKPIFVNFLQ